MRGQPAWAWGNPGTNASGATNFGRMGGKHMATARNLFEKLKSSDGRTKVSTAVGVLAVAAALALSLTLPVSAAHVEPDPISGNPDCTVLDAGDYLFEHKIDNPNDGVTTVDDLVHGDLSGTLTIEVYKVQGNEQFDFSFTGDFDASAVIVKGGSDANLYDYLPSGTIEDEGLHAQLNPRNNKFHEVSHISFCIGEAPNFFCDTPVTLPDEEGPIVEVTAAIFGNSLHQCFDKDATFTNDGDTVTLAFEGDPDTNLKAAGRLDFTKVFKTPPVFEPLEYDGPGQFVDLQFCALRTKALDGSDGGQFDDVLEDDSKYPSLVGVFDVLADDSKVQATACKVDANENADGIQQTVVYFEFEDPQFR
jgi:hypothetical protein